MFNKIDLHSWYYQIWIAEGDKEKTAYCTRYGSYELLVMLFGLINAFATFCTFMNDIFQEWFDDFVVVYIEDILVYNNFMEEHVEHLWKVFQRLKKNNYMLSLRNLSSRWWKWISLDIGSPKKAWRWMTTRWRQFWIRGHLGWFQP